MDFQLDQAIEVLSTTPATLDALLRTKSSAWLNARRAPEAFSPIDVLGHLILADHTDWMPRVRVCLKPNGLHPFPPFDRFAFQAIITNKSIGQILDDFATTRTSTLNELRSLNLSAADLTRQALHPQFGAVTLGQLLATWTVHDLNHIDQIVKTLASKYRDAVGPWSAFLSVLG
jgi:hypothetical protein